jgi:putative ABC transport system ATP-binding protein
VWADEPTGALDSETSAGIMDLMVQLNRQNEQTFVWVTHSEEVGALAKRLIRMRDGLITSDSAVEIIPTRRPSAADLPGERGGEKEFARHD